MERAPRTTLSLMTSDACNTPPVLSADLFARAARSGDVSRLEELQALNCPCDVRACAEAAMAGEIDTVQWLVENGYPTDARTMDGIANGGDCNELEWALESKVPMETTAHYFAANYASETGDVEVLEWLLSNGCPRNARPYDVAISDENDILLEWLYDNKYPMDARVYAVAAKVGTMEHFQKLLDLGCPWDAQTLEDVSSWEKYEWAIQKGCPVTEDIRKSAERRFNCKMNV